MSNSWQDINILDDDELKIYFDLNDSAIQYLNDNNYKVFVYDWKYYQVMKMGVGYISARMTKKEFNRFSDINFNVNNRRTATS